jgi:hypothetical protein
MLLLLWQPVQLLQFGGNWQHQADCMHTHEAYDIIGLHMHQQSRFNSCNTATATQRLPRPTADISICSRRSGFEKPSAIQQKGIVPFTKGLDVIQQAQSGTGKTATFCAGILNNLDYQNLECQVRTATAQLTFCMKQHRAALFETAWRRSSWKPAGEVGELEGAYDSNIGSKPASQAGTTVGVVNLAQDRMELIQPSASCIPVDWLQQHSKSVLADEGLW